MAGSKSENTGIQAAELETTQRPTRRGRNTPAKTVAMAREDF